MHSPCKMDGQWHDVFFTIHKEGNTIKQMRKGLRKTQNNRIHVDKIWGENDAVKTYIPTLIDNYNYWIGGVNVADQCISF